MTFLGLLVLQNQLKPQTAPVIRTLKAANIRSVMITGRYSLLIVRQFIVSAEIQK